jgi:membrane protein required for colicin V production
MAIVVVMIVIAMCGFMGWRAGVVRRVVELAGAVLSILAASRLASQLAPWLDAHTPLGASSSLVIGYLFILVAGLVVTGIAARLVQKAVNLTILGLVDHIGGAVCGIVLGALLVSIGLIAISAAPGGGSVRTTFDRSAVGRTLYRAAPNLYLGARSLAGRKGDQLWQDLLDRGRAAVDEVEQKPYVPAPRPSSPAMPAAPDTSNTRTTL